MSDSPEWHIEAALSGEPTAVLNGKALHSRFDPTREAEKTAASVPPEAAIVVLGGLGLGYVAEALIRSAPQRPLVIAEADENMAARAASVRNLNSLYENPNVSIVTGGDPGDVRSFLTGGPTGSVIHLIVWRPSEETAPEWYAELKSVVDETSRRREVNARTLERFGRLWVRNLAANAAVLPSALSLAPWQNRFTDIPALILAGGPSLELVLPVLKELAQRYLIIVVDTAVSAVLSTGVHPDIIAAVDPQYWNSRHLDRCGVETGKTLILAESATHPAVFRTLNGRPWLTRTRFPLGTLLEDAAGIKGELKAGGSVATAAWDLARYLGCKTLTIAGLDLGFPGGRTHYSGSLSRERPLFYSHRLSPAETLFFHALRDASPRYVESSDGGRVLTDMRMDIYAAWFTESVTGLSKRNPGVVGGNGRRIPGMTIADVADMMKMPQCRTAIDALLDKVRNTPSDPDVPAEINNAVAGILTALKDLENLAGRGADLAIQARRALEHGEDTAVFLQSMEDIDNDILAGEGRDVISFLIQPIILELSSGSPGEDINPLDISRRLYGEIAGSAVYHQRYLKRVSSQTE